jgi:hypothetical protein
MSKLVVCCDGTWKEDYLQRKAPAAPFTDETSPKGAR